jgi:hypothetical protein
MEKSEKDNARSRKSYLKRRANGGEITHVMGDNGRTICGRIPLWNTVIAEVFTCSSCEVSLKKKKDGV